MTDLDDTLFGTLHWLMRLVEDNPHLGPMIDVHADATFVDVHIGPESGRVETLKRWYDLLDHHQVMTHRRKTLNPGGLVAVRGLRPDTTTAVVVKSLFDQRDDPAQCEVIAVGARPDLLWPALIAAEGKDRFHG